MSENSAIEPEIVVEGGDATDSGAGALVPVNGASDMTAYATARQALERAHKIDEVATIRNKAEAIKAYAYQAQDRQLLRWSAEIKLRAERKAGDILCSMRAAGELYTGKETTVVTKQTLKEIGVTRQNSKMWVAESKVSEPVFEKYLKDCRHKVPSTSGLLSIATKHDGPSYVRASISVSDAQLRVLKNHWNRSYPITRQRFRRWIDQPEQQEQPMDQ